MTFIFARNLSRTVQGYLATQWVNVERSRVKDSFTKLWWMAPTQKPKASNQRVLQEYSKAMKTLLKRGTYNAGKRPSEHDISETAFLRDNGGAIPSNVLTYANTQNGDAYQTYCRENELPLHPARMPSDLAKFFIKFLTVAGDVVLDPFGGSNTTGAAAGSWNDSGSALKHPRITLRGREAGSAIE